MGQFSAENSLELARDHDMLGRQNGVAQHQEAPSKSETRKGSSSARGQQQVTSWSQLVDVMNNFGRLSKLYKGKNEFDRQSYLASEANSLRCMSFTFLSTLLDDDPLGRESCEMQLKVMLIVQDILHNPELAEKILSFDMLTEWMRFFLAIAEREIPESARRRAFAEGYSSSPWWRCRIAALRLLLGIYCKCSKRQSQLENWMMDTFRGSAIELAIQSMRSFYDHRYQTAPIVIQLSVGLCVQVIDERLSSIDRMRIFYKVLVPLARGLARLVPSELIEMQTLSAKHHRDELLALLDGQRQLMLAKLTNGQDQAINEIANWCQEVLTRQQTDPDVSGAALITMSSLVKSDACEQAEFSKQLVKNHIARALKDPNELVRCAACLCLKKSPHLQRLSQLWSRQLVRVALDDTDLQVKYLALLSLGESTSRKEKFSSRAVERLLARMLCDLSSPGPLGAKKQNLICYINELVRVYPHECHSLMTLDGGKTRFLSDILDTHAMELSSASNSDHVATMLILDNMFVLLDLVEKILKLSIENRREVEDMEPNLIRMIDTSLNSKKFTGELRLKALKLLQILSSRIVSSEQLRFMDTMQRLLLIEGSGHFAYMAPILHNFITKEPLLFSTSPKKMEILYIICLNLLLCDHSVHSYEARAYAAKLLEVTTWQFNSQDFRQNYLGRVTYLASQVLERDFMIENGQSRDPLESEDKMRFRSQVLQLICSAFSLDSSATLNALHKLEQDKKYKRNRLIELFLNYLVSDAIREDLFWPRHEKRVVMRLICALIRLPGRARPDCVQAIAPKLLTIFARQFEDIHDLYGEYLFNGCGFDIRKKHHEKDYLKWAAQGGNSSDQFATSIDVNSKGKVQCFEEEIAKLQSALDGANSEDQAWYHMLMRTLDLPDKKLLVEHLFVYASIDSDDDHGQDSGCYRRRCTSFSRASNALRSSFRRTFSSRSKC